jgi:nitrate/nitrite-specific signal transduction histidine kinase
MDVTRLAVPESTICEPKCGSEAGTGFLLFKPGLSFKLLFLVVSVSLIGVLAATIFLFDFQRRQLIDNAQSATMALSNTIEANLHHAMLTDDWTMASDVVQAVAAEGTLDTVRILDTQGVVGVSSRPNEVGERFDQTEPACQFCHTGSAPPSNKTIVFTSDAGHQVLLNVNLIQNQLECQACHSPENQILGLLMIETPLTALHDQLTAGFRRTILLAMATFALLVGLMVPALRRHVIRPLDELSKGVAEISAGNLDYRVQAANHDELGELAESFDAMRQQLKTSHAEMTLREQELAILNEVGQAATQLLDVQEIMDFALDTVVNKLGMAAGLIYLLDEATGRYTLRASHGVSKAQIEEIDQRRRSGWDITQEVAETGKEVFVADMASDVRFYGVWDNLQGRSYVKLPMMSKGTVVGVIGLITPIGHSVTQRAVEFLKAVGREIGIAIDNAMLLADTRWREQQAMTLYELGTRISASLALGEVLDAVAEAARELLAADIGLVGLLDEERQEVLIKAAAGIGADALKGMRIPVDGQAPGTILVEGRPIMAEVDDPDRPILHDGDLIAEEGIISFLAVPLQRGERFLGLVEVMTRQRRRFLQRDAQLLMRLVHHVVVAIENAQLYRQLRYLAALEERDRLAREMHDHLAQALGYLNVKASITDGLLSRGQIGQAQESLLELKNVTKVVYTDVREAIFNLRTAVSSRIGLLPTLQDYLAEYRAHYGVDACLVNRDEDSAVFSPEVASQLLRIVQEALTNVRKHAGASRAWVRCQQDGDQVCISIEDDGQGFDPAQVTEEGGQCFGLQIMRERAESVGGSLELDSRPGQGTRVVIRIPLTSKEWEA